MKTSCRKPDIGFSFARKAESLSYSESAGGNGVFENYSTKNVPAAVIEMTQTTT